MKMRFIAMILLTLMMPAQAFAANCSDPAGDLDTLTCNVYHESRGEDIVGMFAVAHVTLNRAASGIFPNTIRSVVFQRGQFSWINDGRPDSMNEPEEVERARMVARIAPILYEAGVLEEITGLSDETMWFHSMKGTPKDFAKFDFVKQIGGHKFYEK